MRRALLGALLLAGASPAVAAPGDGWSLRGAENSPPVALIEGPGLARSVAVFCLSGEPFLALMLTEPKASTVRVDFGFSDEDWRGTAAREDLAGSAYVVALRGDRLAGLLAGKDSRADLAIDGAAQGELSLAGSSDMIGAALESCAPL